MWIFLNNAFLSIVQYESRPDVLLVRSRIVGDIERVFSQAKVTHTPESDYSYRARVARHEVAQRLARGAEEIGYPNSKNSVEELDRRTAYLKGWSVMREFQKRQRRTP